ncbi:MAG: hypothetical protein K2Y22_17815 [Candidatus Obscuribacterales bacterium]|nr:hypothetical protein [Candidatus Obscuribacterales bacterium]
MDKTGKESNPEIDPQSAAAKEKLSEELADTRVYFRDGLVSGLEGKDGQRTTVVYDQNNDHKVKYRYGAPLVSEVIFADNSKLKHLPDEGLWQNDHGERIDARVVVHQPSMMDNQAYVRYRTANGELKTIFAAREVTGACLPNDGQLLMDLWKKNLPSIDRDSDKEIRLSELVKAVADPSFTGLDAIFVATLKRRFDIISGFGKQKDRETVDDNKDGKLNSPEVQKALLENDYDLDTLEKVKKIQEVKRFSNPFELKKALAKPAISQGDIESLAQAFSDFRPAYTGKVSKVHDDVDTVFNSWILYQNKASFITDKLYEYGPSASIKPKYVLQGDSGDCYWQSSLMALAQTTPKLIKDMIRPGDTTPWNVYFPQKGWTKQAIAVSRPTDVEQLLYSGAAGGGLWAGVLESAMAINRDKWSDKHTRRTEDQTLQDYADGGVQREMMQMLTDKFTTTTSPHVEKPENLEKLLQQSIDKKLPMGAGMDKPTVEGLHGNHNYAILGYDRDAKTIEMLDPNHYLEPVDKKDFAKDGVRDGKFTLTMEEFRGSCDELSYMEKSPVPEKYMTDLYDDSNIIRDDVGKVVSVTQDEAIKLCKQQGGHLPTAREYAEYINPIGILEVDYLEKKLNGKVPDGFYKVECVNPDGKVDSFYYNNENSQKLTGEISKLSFWTSSKVVGNDKYGHVFYGWLGGGRQSKDDHEANYKHAVLIIRDKVVEQDQ